MGIVSVRGIGAWTKFEFTCIMLTLR